MISEMKEITKVRLLYDNNEDIAIPVKYIGTFHMYGFDRMVGLLENNRLHSMTTVDTFTLGVNNSINVSGIGLSYDTMLSPEELDVPLTARLKERLDLVALELCGDSGEEELIYLAHDNESEYYNSNIVIETTDKGGVSIKLKPNK